LLCDETVKLCQVLTSEGSERVKSLKGRTLDQQLLNRFPQIARHFKYFDRTDMGPLDNKDEGI